MDLRSALCVGLAVLSLTLVSCNLQENMLYYPSKYVPSKVYCAAHNIAFWPADPPGNRGFMSLEQVKSVRGTIVVFHGNAGTAADRVYYIQSLAQLGFRVILAEYPGYGGRSGDIGEKSFVRDATETVRLVSEQFGAPIYLLGESLGSGVVAGSVKISAAKVKGVILITPWDTLLSIARDKFPWLPVRLFLKDTYDSIDNLKGYHGRIAIVGADQDEVVPVQHAEALYTSLAGQREAHHLYIIKGAGHNDWPEMVDVGWWKDIIDFVQDDGRR